MKTNRPRHANQTGGILLIVMVVLIAFSLMVVALLQLGQNSAREAEYQFNTAQAFSLAEAGLEQFKAIVNANRFPISTSIAAARDWSTTVPNAGSYRVKVDDDTRNGWDNSTKRKKKYIITSVGSARNGAVQTNRLSAEITTRSEDLWSTHDEGNIWFQTGDYLSESVYTDGRLNINGTPVFKGLVQSAANSVKYANGGSSAVFEGGLKLDMPALDWTSAQQQVNDLATASGAEILSGNYDITFADKKAIVGVHGSTSVSTNSIPAEKIFYVTGNAYVKGTVGTRVTVATSGSIHIMGDITYKSAASKPADPAAWGVWVPDSAELLGLFSKSGNVQIDSSVPGTIKIHAAILAPSSVTGTGSFGADNYTKSHSGVNWFIYFYGSLSQYTRGTVGQVGGNGYLKKYSYDSRFRDTPPPGTPYNVFSFSEWKQL